MSSSEGKKCLAGWVLRMERGRTSPRHCSPGIVCLTKKKVILTCFNPEIPIVFHSAHQTSHRELRLRAQPCRWNHPQLKKSPSLWATENRQSPLSRGEQDYLDWLSKETSKDQSQVPASLLKNPLFKNWEKFHCFLPLLSWPCKLWQGQGGGAKFC